MVAELWLNSLLTAEEFTTFSRGIPQLPLQYILVWWYNTSDIYDKYDVTMWESIFHAKNPGAAIEVNLVFLPLSHSHCVFLCGFTNCQKKKNMSVLKGLFVFAGCSFAVIVNSVPPSLPSEVWQSQNQIRPPLDAPQTGARWLHGSQR